ncbi:hypothetical protein ACGF12_22620 [Kitasatospora sp. NPDC048296]|uniref:hypothetical protein n=1 Tax=Kitasatospora sp. NPDC048296 TaxID=3364048 RepID=UPI003723516F
MPTPTTSTVHPAQKQRDTSNDLLVLHLRISERKGAVAELTMSVPTPHLDAIGWELAHLAAYVGHLHSSGQDPTGEGAYEFLRARTPWAWYPWQPLHDTRVTCQLDVLLGPLDETGWPAESLVVLESEDGKWGFSRKRLRPGAAAAVGIALEEIEGAHSHLCSRAARDDEAETAQRRDEADALLTEVRAVHGQLKGRINSEGARRARAALHVPPGHEPGTSRFEQLDPVPERLETFTGRIAQIDSRTNADTGETVVLFAVEHDQGRAGTSGVELPAQLRCTLRGEAASAAADDLSVGRRVVVAGRLEMQIYRSKEQPVPRSLVTFKVRGVSLDLAA